ncbi:MAG TPA: LPS export ABC transporter periplasmic protein LptC [Thermoanaerobaculia bacterium]|nr:LPS export ABC transporter periplasmic protein LptC [Thermoanaerobaculia bacterium]
MQRTIRILRVALPIAFFGFILLIAFSWNRARVQKDRAITQPVTSTIRPNEKSPNIESKTFEDTQTIAGRIASRIRAQRVVAFQSGWNTLENVQLSIYRPTGRTYELVCPTAQFNSETKEADAKGGVKVTSSDGVEITTAEIHFDGNRLTNHIPVQFKIDRWTGNAGALDLDVQSERLRLYDKLDAAMPAVDPGESAMSLKSQEGTFNRKENTATFESDVVMTHDTSRLAGDRVVAHLSADRKSLMGVEGQGHIDIITTDDAPGSGRKEIVCDRFWSEVTNGQIRAINAEGATAPVHAVVAGPPARDLVAKSVRVALVNRQVNEMRAESNVVMKELGALPREMTADHLTIAFDPNQHRAVAASIEGNFHYKDPKNQASAVRANYDIVGDHVVLTATPGFDPTVTSEGQTLKAKLIDFSPRAGTAKATGEVIAQIITKQNPQSDVSAMFPSSKPVFVNSDAVSMRQATKLAVFTGHVRAWQDNNTLFADEMQVQGMGDQITARGNVRTSLYNTGGTEQRKTPMLTRSDHFAAHKTDRRIDLLGNVKIDDDQRHLTGEKASFFFDAAHKLERIEAENKIVLLEQPAGRKGTGEKATYFVNRRVIYMNGSPATVTTPNGSVSGDQIAIDLTRNKVEIMSPTSATKGTYKPQ